MNNIDYADILIEDLMISVRLKNVLLSNHILSFQDLLDCSNDRIFEFRNAGIKTLNEAIELKKHPENIAEYIDKNNIKKILENIRELENQISIEFINDLYSNISLKDYGTSSRLRSNLKRKKVVFVSELLLISIDEYNSYKNFSDDLLKEVIKIKSELLDFSNPDNRERLLFNTISFLVKDNPKSVVYIRNYLYSNTNYAFDNYIDDLNNLKNNGMIEITMDGIELKKMHLTEFVKTIEDKKKREMLSLRLSGATLEEIGTKEGLTRERVRQIIAKLLKKLPNVYENKYKFLFEKYNFSENQFCKIFEESKKTYNYLNLVYNQGNMKLVDGIDSNDFNENQKNKIKELENIVTIFGENYNGTKFGVIESLAKEYASEGILIGDFTKIYNNYVKEKSKLNLDLLDERSMSGVLSRQNFTIFDFGHKFRYYNESNIDASILKKIETIISLDDGYYSTLVIYNNNIDFMKEIDIRNEYELHNLLKKHQDILDNIRFDRTPNFSIGDIDKYDFTLSKINELSPITVGEFLDYMEDNYGHKSSTFLAYITTEFGDFINGNYIDSDVVEINDELIIILKELLTEPLYLIEDLNNILVENGFENPTDIITKNTMYKIGYRIRSTYILKKEYDSFDEYIIELSKNNDFIKNDNIINSSTYNISIKRVQKNYDIVSISNSEFITITKLNKLGITKEIINKFCNDVYTSFNSIMYFSLQNIKDLIDTSWIEDNGFDDIFYECLIETIDNIKFLKVNNQKIYSFIDDYVEIDDIINEFMTEDSIYIDELVDDIKEKYGIDVSYEKLINSDKFYSRELNKLYLNKDCYYKEVYNYE